MTEDGSLYRSTLNSLKLSKNTFFTGWFCDLETHSASIKLHGNIKYSTCAQPDNNKVCQIRNCWCGTDVEIPKAINQETLIQFKQKVNQPDAKIIKHDFKEPAPIIAVGKEEFLQDKEYHIDWFLGRLCNYDCSYCPPRIHNNYEPFKTLEEYKKQITAVNIDPNKKISVLITGGEPTLFKELYDLILWLKQNYSNMEITLLTNGTAHEDVLCKFHEHCKLTISFHAQYVNEKLLDKFERFLNKTPYTNIVDFKSFESNNYDYFYNKVKHLGNWIHWSNEIPIVNKETTVWDFENKS